MHFHLRTGCKAAALCLFVIVFLALPFSAQIRENSGKGVVKVMTYNANEGSDFTEVLSAQTFPDFLAAVQITLMRFKSR